MRCSFYGNEWLSYLITGAYILVLLYLLGDTADSFFCPTLQSVVSTLKMSPTLAGVTFLSFGNGAPDVFASVAAVGSGSSNLALGALIGASVFVTTIVVAGVVFAAPDSRLKRECGELWLWFPVSKRLISFHHGLLPLSPSLSLSPTLSFPLSLSPSLRPSL